MIHIRISLNDSYSDYTGNFSCECLSMTLVLFYVGKHDVLAGSTCKKGAGAGKK